MAVPNKSFQPKPGGFKKPNTGGGFNKGGFNRGRFAPRKEAEHRINHFIRVPQVRLVGDNVTPGVYATNEAIKMAQEQALDLVEISPNADPPVCKIIDYNKFLYDKKKKEKEMTEGKAAIRRQGKGDLGAKLVEEFIADIRTEIQERVSE